MQEVKYRVINTLASKYALTRLSRFLSVARSGYYKWLARSKEKSREKMLCEQIMSLQKKHKFRYGYRRITLALMRQHGQKHNHKKVLRIMQKYNLLSVIRRKWQCAKGTKGTLSANILNRNFSASRKNNKWVTDISYIFTGEGRLYLSAIKDCYDGSIVAYKYSTAMNNNLVTSTIQAALKKEHPEGLTIHSDRGFQYVSFEYNSIMKENSVQASMSRAGTPIDNAPMESFFSILKTECIYLEKPKTIAEAKNLIDEFIDYYNNERVQLRHGMTPAEYRKKSLAG